MLEIVKRACEVVGGAGVLAAKLCCTRQALHEWKRVPRGRAIEIEEVTAGAVLRHEMRPDLWPLKSPAAQEGSEDHQPATGAQDPPGDTPAGAAA